MLTELLCLLNAGNDTHKWQRRIRCFLFWIARRTNSVESFQSHRKRNVSSCRPEVSFAKSGMSGRISDRSRAHRSRLINSGVKAEPLARSIIRVTTERRENAVVILIAKTTLRSIGQRIVNPARANKVYAILSSLHGASNRHVRRGTRARARAPRSAATASRVRWWKIAVDKQIRRAR